VRRKRFQNGSLQKTDKHGKHKMWILQYREGGVKQYHTIGPCSKMTKSQAQEKQAEFMQEVNARQAQAPDKDMTFGDFIEGVALPFYRPKWKGSTAITTESRMRHHLQAEFGEEKLSALTLKRLQAMLSSKAASYSKSTVAHLRWDLRLIFKLAMAEGFIERDPTSALYTPKEARVAAKRVMTGEEVEQHIAVQDVRERVIAHLAIFVGMRPGEILALQRRHISEDFREVTIEQRLYRADIDVPKTNSSKRTAAIPTQTAGELRQWMEMVGKSPKAWIFASENSAKPMWRDNVWIRNMQPRLEAVGLGWANFQVMRRTHASLGHDAEIDPKVSADQRGHGIGVAINVYTQSSMAKRRGAAQQLEDSVLTGNREEDTTASHTEEAVKRAEKRSSAA
jgi:integrase